MKKLSMILTIIAVSLIGTISIKADALQDWASSQSRYRYDDHGTNTYSSWETTPHTWEPTLPVNKMQWRVKATDGLSYENTYIIKFAYRPIPQAITPTRIQVYADTGTVEYEDITCGQWAYNSDNFNVVQCTFTPRNNISANTWLIIEVNFTQGYLTSLRSYMNKYEERTGTNAVITQTGDQITNEINELGDTITNIINETNTNIVNAITEQNKTCKTTVINKNTDGNQKGALASNCNPTGSTSSLITKTFKIEEGTTITGLRTLGYYCFYDENMTAIGTRTQTSASQITIPNGAKFIRFQVQNNVYDFASIYQCMSNTDAILDQDHTYNKEDISDQVNNEHNKQQEILENIDDSYIESQEWEEIGNILNSSRGEWLMQKLNTTGQMHQKVFLMLTTVLALGIIKMILGR